LPEGHERCPGRYRPLFKAHLQANDLFAVTDILEPRDKGWFLWEVKASTRREEEWKPVLDWDLAFQVCFWQRWPAGPTVEIAWSDEATSSIP